MIAALISAGMMAAGPSPDVMIARADVNHDGRVTRAEFIDMRAKNFDRLDRNHDGYITQSDMGQGMAQRLIASREPDIFGRLDTNRDGRISRQEFATGPAPVFDMADTNQDGAIDKAELAALRDTAQRARGY
ncbi:EF-hand domain-containing protein [Phenylobacterium sp.]|uniref:EF-hand domain-containing protein n=1 Tax=Phenylobacterium sp. TaxID=1871053 RepID=UPI0035B35150